MSKTRYDSNNNLRKNYIYIHDLLYPLFIQLPQFINRERRHQYLIFSSDKSLEKIKKWLKILADKLGYSDKEVVVSIVNGKSKQAMTAVNNARDISR